MFEETLLKALKEKGIKASLWEKHGLRRIYLSKVPGQKRVRNVYIDLDWEFPVLRMPDYGRAYSDKANEIRRVVRPVIDEATA